MTPWIEVDTATIPGQGEPMRLMRQDDVFTICVGNIELMSSLSSQSEAVLATHVCERLRDPPSARILVGGLGMGFTLRAALDALGPDSRVVVAELVPAVVAWARGPLAHLYAGCLDDPRVEIRQDDVNRVIQEEPAFYDAILLDVDNGPEGMTRTANDRLYDEWGLKRARYALKPGGVLAVWSGGPDRKFKARLRRTGFAVEERRVHAHGTSGRRHVLWFATLPHGREDSIRAFRPSGPAA
ncbi:MAG: hypothetical protein PGN34_13570 [Methylobacterium frigidaeris]